MSLLIFLINTMTFICIWKKLRVQRKGTGLESDQQMSTFKKNIKFYVQGCLSSAIMILTIISFHIFPRMARTRMQGFMVTTLTMEITHISDGIILVLFNKPFRSIFYQPQSLFKKAQTSLQTAQPQSRK
ncbi:hypothetical protein Y032_0057g2838 [Ancylostoma ceylanicum]|uniref:7TM GPCR serpentine receptor class x (Srx) domain-containing protein n=1 Tax=Ancylostoma ceylanicum TaxID=53326 RepID=A0A016U503_9BILA|nr:hypothetical protein Y032_0057g2838 [Ancylostoma ceylanicum]